jgi:hypothetical protein
LLRKVYPQFFNFSEVRSICVRTGSRALWVVTPTCRRGGSRARPPPRGWKLIEKSGWEEGSLGGEIVELVWQEGRSLLTLRARYGPSPFEHDTSITSNVSHRWCPQNAGELGAASPYETLLNKGEHGTADSSIMNTDSATASVVHRRNSYPTSLSARHCSIQGTLVIRARPVAISSSCSLRRWFFISPSLLPFCDNR